MGSGNEILDMYIYETGTLLEQLETIVLEAEKADTFSQENVNEIFRIMHTIKGSSAMMEFDSLATVAHRIEDMFFIIREGTMSVVSEENRPALFDVVFQSIDFFRGEVEKVESGEPLDKDIDSFLTNINTLISKIKGEEPAQPETPLIFADNGVQARTLTPSSPEGYIVTGNVYINNRSEKSFDETLFDGSFAARLSEEEGPKVLILHTHGSEAYTMPPGQEYEPSGESRTTDCAYNVVRVGDELARTLEEAGIGVVHDPSLYDYPEYSGAYGRSLTAAERAMEEYPSISLVLDIHRDAISDADGSPYKVVSGVAGVNAAQMSFIIGSDGGGLEHEGWRENLKLAAALQQRLTEDYPTLMRPVSVRNSRYNQHVSPGALLVEMGAAGNSLDEALLSARLLGQAIGQLFLEKS